MPSTKACCRSTPQAPKASYSSLPSSSDRPSSDSSLLPSAPMSSGAIPASVMRSTPIVSIHRGATHSACSWVSWRSSSSPVVKPATSEST